MNTKAAVEAFIKGREDINRILIANLRFSPVKPGEDLTGIFQQSEFHRVNASLLAGVMSRKIGRGLTPEDIDKTLPQLWADIEKSNDALVAADSNDGEIAIATAVGRKFEILLTCAVLDEMRQGLDEDSRLHKGAALMTKALHGIEDIVGRLFKNNDGEITTYHLVGIQSFLSYPQTEISYAMAMAP